MKPSKGFTGGAVGPGTLLKRRNCFSVCPLISYLNALELNITNVFSLKLMVSGAKF